MATKKMTLKYWGSLDEGSKRRALSHVFPINNPIVQILMNEKPDKKKTLWQLVFQEVRIPEDNSHYKTVVHNTYIP